MTKGIGSGRNARWGLLISAVLMGLALIGFVASNYVGVREVSGALAQGQGELLLQSLRRGLQQVRAGAPGPPSALELETVLEANVDLGLRYVALLDRNGEIFVDAGVSAEPPVSLPDGAPEPRIALLPGGIVRMHPPARPMRRRAPDSRGGPHPGPADVLIEFKPILVEDLRARATEILVVGLVSAIGLMFAAAVFWRQSARADAAREGLERQRRLASLGQMSAVLAHELRNPLASLKGHAQLLEERLPEGSRERDKAARVVREAERLEGLANDLLDFVRSGQIRRQATSPAALLREAAEVVGAERFQLGLDAAPSTWSVDPARMHQVLTNLLENACHASPEGRPVEATARQTDGHLIFSIRDFGAGIPEGEQDRIFEPFHTTRTRGVGLGLAVARRIVELHDGTLTASNHPDGGAVFEVSLPRG